MPKQSNFTKVAQLITCKSICLTAFAWFLTGCDYYLSQSAVQKGFAASGGSKNVAVLMSGSGEQHIPKNIAMIRDVMSDPQVGYNFTIIERQKVTAEQAVQTTAEAAKQVGDGGTLLWYFSSHGAPNGSLTTYSRMLKLKQITDAIKSARGGVPLKRLVMIVQACYSGQIVNGSAKVGNSSYSAAADDASSIPDQFMNELLANSSGSGGQRPLAYASNDYTQIAEQILVLSAASRSEMSMYSGDGSHFTKALHKTFKSFGNAPTTNMKTFLEAVQKNVRSSRPQYRAEPEDVILQEPLNKALGLPVRKIFAAISDRGDLWVQGSEPIRDVELCLASTLEASRQCSQYVKATSNSGFHVLNLKIPSETKEFFVKVRARKKASDLEVSQSLRLSRRVGLR